MIDRYAFHLENVEGRDLETLLEVVLLEYYGSAPSVPLQIIVLPGMGDLDALGSTSCSTCAGGRRGAVACPRREEAARWARLRERAPRPSPRPLADRAAAPPQGRGAGATPRDAQPGEPASADRMLGRLQHPGRLHRRINGGVPRRGSKKAHYRSFAVRGQEGQDDSLRWRRWCRAGSRDSGSPRASAAWDASFGATPNLVVVGDGGRGQLSAALDAIHSTYDLPRVAVVALAKRRRRCTSWPRRPGRARAARSRAPALGSGSAMRPTARRRIHRRRRDTKAFESIFDTLPGVYPKRRRAILRHFGSADRFLEASQEESGGVPGLPARTARQPCTPSSTRPEVPRS